MTMSALDPRQAHIQELGETHGFSLEQIELNRKGQLHPAQVRKGRSSGVGGSIFAIVLGLLFTVGGVGGALLLYDDFTKPVSDGDMRGLYALGGGGILIGSLFDVGAALGFRKVAQRRKLYEQGAPMVVEGQLRKVHIQGRQGVPSQWRYVIGGVSFQVSSKGFELTTQGARYRVFHLAGDLLSIEPL